jgi:hypothetical protein
MKKMMILLVGNICLHLFIYGFMRDPLERFLFERTVTKDRLPGNYWFLLFPIGDVPVLDAEHPNVAKRVGSLTRAVSASMREIRSGLVGVSGLDRSDPTEGVVRLENLRFLPGPGGADHIERYQQVLRSRRMDAHVELIQDSPGWHLVRFEHFDHKHARSFTFRYRTDGHEIEPLSMRINSGFFVIMILGSFFVSSAILKAAFQKSVDRYSSRPVTSP